MTKAKILLAGLVAGAAFGITPVLHAQSPETGFYAGVGVGRSKARDACNPVPSVTITSCDDTDTAWRIFGGYRLHRNVAVEMGYADGGKYKASGIVSGVQATGEVKAKAFDFDVVGILPLYEQFSLLAKVGFAAWNLDASGSALGLTASQSANGTSFLYGAGAQYDLTRQFGLRLEWQRYADVGDKNTTGQSNVDVIAASVLFKF